jgi:lysozyme family protein
MGDFERCINLILAEEGGLSRNNADPGGLTKYGISQRSYPELNIPLLTIEQAKALYQHDYWQPIHGDMLPAGLDLLMLDCDINQGTPTAILMLQRALGVKNDGVIGPMTLTSAFQAMPALLDSFAAERALSYVFNRNEAVFGRGWYHRLFRIHRMAWSFAMGPTA